MRDALLSFPAFYVAEGKVVVTLRCLLMDRAADL